MGSRCLPYRATSSEKSSEKLIITSTPGWKLRCNLGLTPWIALHLFYIMILTLFAWLNRNGFTGDAAIICEGLYAKLSWLVPVSEALMLPVFVWWFWLQINGKTVFPRWMAFTNVLTIYGVLKGVSLLMPVSAFRLGFTNGLMSESMIVWFAAMLISAELRPCTVARIRARKSPPRKD